MTTLKDLSRFNYYPWIKSENLVAIGWLGPTSKFDVGNASDDFIRSMADVLRDPFTVPFAAMGWHDCELCIKGASSITSIGGVSVSSRSSREIYVPFESRIYVSPESIGHYIACHRYMPPKEYVKAVCNCPPVRSMEFKKLFLKCGGGALL